MKDRDIILLAGLAIGGYYLVKKTNDTLAPITSAQNSIGNVISNAQNTTSDLLGNIQAAIANIFPSSSLATTQTIPPIVQTVDTAIQQAINSSQQTYMGYSLPTLSPQLGLWNLDSFSAFTPAKGSTKAYYTARSTSGALLYFYPVRGNYSVGVYE